MSTNKIITQGYKAIMSSGDAIRIEHDEIDRLMKAAGAGTFVRVRQGVINPSFLVSIVVDKTRDMRYESGPRNEAKALGLMPLRDIFAPVVERKELGAGN